VSGCTGPSDAGTAPDGARPSADEAAAGRAVLAARSLLTTESRMSAGPRVAAVVAAIADSHRAHLAALGLPDLNASPSGPPTSGTPTSPPAGPATGTPPTTAPDPAGPATAPAVVVRRELAASGETLADVVRTTGATAGLLARIAAARAVHADLLAAAAGLPAPDRETLPPATPAGGPLDDETASGLSALLAGEHAAVFAYGLVTARAAPDREPLARTLWAAHRARRGELERRLVTAGRAPVAALPAYDVGRLPATPVQLAAFTATVEDGLARAALVAVTGTAGTVRSESAEALVRAARRAAAWRGAVDPLPGTPA